MAQLPSVTPYNVQLSGVGGAVTPGVSFGAQRRPDIAYQGQAQYQQTLSKALDRMSNTLFGMAAAASERAGLQFVADNPASQEQLNAMVSGQPLKLDFAVPGTAYGDAVNKARAIELSTYAEVEGQKLIETLEAQVDAGSINALTASNTFSNFVDGVASSLAEQTPDASFKFRASMATTGRAFISSVANKELAKQRALNIATVEQFASSSINDIVRELKNPGDNSMEVVKKYQDRFAINALPLVGASKVTEYQGKMGKEITNALVSEIVKELTNDQYFDNSVATLNNIAKGEIPNVEALTGYLMANDPEALKSIASQFRTMISDRITQRNEEEAARKRENEVATIDGMVEYFDPNTQPLRKRVIVRELAQRGALTTAQMEKFLDQNAAEGDKFVEADLEVAIVNGEITDPDELKQQAIRARMNGTQYQRLMGKLLSGVSADEKRAYAIVKENAGVPDVRSQFVSNDDAHKIIKKEKIMAALDQKVKEFRENPSNAGKSTPWETLAKDAVKEYNAKEGANPQKTAAKQALAKQVSSLVSSGKVKFGFEITADTNIEDLIARGILEDKTQNGAKTVSEIKRLQSLLRSPE